MPRESISPEVDDEIKKTRLEKDADIYQEREDLLVEEKWERMGGKERFEFFKNFYLKISAVALFSLVMVIILIYFLSRPAHEKVFFAAMYQVGFINGHVRDDEVYDFIDYLGIEGADNLNVTFDRYTEFVNEDTWFRTYVRQDKFDILITREFPVYGYKESDLVSDLSVVLPADLYRDLSERDILYYADSEDGSSEFPAGIFIPTDQFFDYPAYQPVEKPIFCIFSNTTRLDTAIQYIKFMLEK